MLKKFGVRVIHRCALPTGKHGIMADALLCGCICVAVCGFLSGHVHVLCVHMYLSVSLPVLTFYVGNIITKPL
jgi:hypothetical protein